MYLVKMRPLHIVLIVFFIGFIGIISPGEVIPREDPNLPLHYPDEFDGRGRVGRIAQNLIVIDDSSYIISPATSFHTPTMRNAPWTWLKVGQLVGFVESNRGEIISLYLIK